MSRRDARRHAFSIVYQFPFISPLGDETLAEAKFYYYDGLEAGEKPEGDDAAYIERAVWGAYERRGQIDGVIEHFLVGWDIGRISKVDLAVLRLSIYEMLCEDDVPIGAAVNEAVELAKRFGSDESPAFVNGVLGGVSREMEAKQNA